MGTINITKCNIEGLFVLEPTIMRDDHGYIIETYNKYDMTLAGLNMNFVQDNQSFSYKGVLRGLHLQKKFPQGKLVRVIRGSIYDVAVDLRKNSKSFGLWYGLELTSENMKQFYIPEGFAHGFIALSDEVEFCFKCTNYYYPEHEIGLLWNDPMVGIEWPISDKNLIISERDRNLKNIEEIVLLLD